MGLVLQGPPLGSSLDVKAPSASDDFAVPQSRAHVIVLKALLFQLAHSELLGWVCYCSLIGPGVLRVGSMACVGGGTVSLQWSVG